ncbi:hypothetical protein [Streptomyces aquilus]|uniref:hypothetical protein n=1 Tax=Streptomyces aquilus TaxID=2548456 RepID=UPI0036BD8E8B
MTRRHRLADAARDADWATAFRALEEVRAKVNAHWVTCARLDGPNGYTPLHQAAWHGAPVATAPSPCSPVRPAGSRCRGCTAGSPSS